MSGHDPVCPWSEMAGHGVTPPPVEECVYCPMIRTARADALSRFHVTEFPNGKVQTLIVDGTNWVSVRTANSMADRARADERSKAAVHSTGTDTGGPCCQCCYEVHDLRNELAAVADHFEARQVERENLGGV